MKRLTVWALLAVFSILSVAGCAGFGGNAKQQALQALVTTTRSADLLMTAAGLAYNAGAFGAPGSSSAEATWDKIAAQSVLLSGALNDWQAAVEAGKDGSAYSSVVGQALAIIATLLPAKRTEFRLPDFTVHDSIARLACPDSLRASSLMYAGGGL